MNTQRLIEVLTSKKMQVVGILLPLMFVVYSITALPNLNPETDANYAVKRGILITSGVVFGIFMCTGIVSFILLKRQKK